MRRWARKLVRVYSAMLKASLSGALEYRAQLFLWVISSVFPLVMMNVWLALVSEAKEIQGWDRADFLSYYVGMMLVTNMTGSWILWDWDDDIRTGALSVKLLKPVDPLHYIVANQLGWKMLVMLIMLPLVVVVAVISPEVNFPLTFPMLLAFIVTIILGFILQTVIACSFAMLGFWSTQVRNLYQLWWGVGQFLSGYIAPLAMLPPALQGIALLLPYRGYLGLPLEILTGALSWPEIGFGVIVSLVWMTVFFVIFRLLWRLGLRRYEAVGG